MKAIHRIEFGAVQGRIPLDDQVVARCRELALDYHAACVRSDWSLAEEVKVLAVPEWMPPLASWLPSAQLANMGLRVSQNDMSWNELLTSSRP